MPMGLQSSAARHSQPSGDTVLIIELAVQDDAEIQQDGCKDANDA
jgi:hypothetical protein